MTYTSHGHHISGSVLDSGDAPPKARCGGPGLCGKCSAEQAAWQKEADRLAEIKKLGNRIGDFEEQPEVNGKR